MSHIPLKISSHNTLHVAKNGNDTFGDGSMSNPFLTISQCISYINTQSPSIGNQFFISVGAGLFIEAPFTLPPYTLLQGSFSRTTVLASDPNSNLITLDINTTIESITLTGVTDPSAFLINVSGTATGNVGLTGVIMTSASNGITVSSTTGTITTVINEGFITNISGEVVVAGTNSKVVIDSVIVKGNSSTTVALSQDDGELVVSTAAITNCLSSLDIKSNTGAVRVYSMDSSSNDFAFRQTGLAKVYFNGGRIDTNQVDVIDWSVIDGFIYSEVETEETLQVLSELSVGVAGKGRESALGEGDTYVTGMAIYTYDNTTFVDVSTAAKTASGSSFTFPSTGLNNYIYVTTTLLNTHTSSPIKWYGIKSLVDTASVGGNIIAEYWNGFAWTTCNTMSSESTGAYLPYGSSLFERIGSEQVRFDDTISSDWALSDPVGIGTSYYWVRFSIESVLTTAPVFQQFKIHSNRTKINADGFVEYFGTARPLSVIPFTVNSFSAANVSPSNADVYVGDNLSSGRAENSFIDGVTDRSGLAEFLPYDTDTSHPLSLSLYLIYSDATVGDVNWTVRWAFTEVGDSVYSSLGDAPTTAVGEQSINLIEPALGVANQLATITFDLDISAGIPRRSTSLGDILWISIQRAGGTAVDTYSGNVNLVQVALTYLKWSSGGHVGI